MQNWNSFSCFILWNCHHTAKNFMKCYINRLKALICLNEIEKINWNDIILNQINLKQSLFWVCWAYFLGAVPCFLLLKAFKLCFWTLCLAFLDLQFFSPDIRSVHIEISIRISRVPLWQSFQYTMVCDTVMLIWILF